jgi:hypothetical protein
LNRAWMKFWLSVSLLTLTVSAGAASQKHNSDKGKNELTLAAIQPGRDKLSGVEKQLSDRLRTDEADSPGGHAWTDPCSGHRLALEVDRAGVIQTVTISSSNAHENCKSKVDPKKDPLWVTGAGIRLGDLSEHVVEVYGAPSSGGPSVKQGHELELMFYMFDWAGSNVPQVMEISCDKETGRVVEIMLAFPSL